jgi:hypothetical protein
LASIIRICVESRLNAVSESCNVHFAPTTDPWKENQKLRIEETPSRGGEPERKMGAEGREEKRRGEERERR